MTEHDTATNTLEQTVARKRAHLADTVEELRGRMSSDALARELREEIALHAAADAFAFQGIFSEVAANEPDARVVAHTYSLRVAEPVTPAAEIEDARWVPLDGELGLDLAPLTQNRMFPLARKLAGAAQ